MQREQFEKIENLKFQEEITINGNKLYRGNDPWDLNTKDVYKEYNFYEKWDKNKNILPPTSHKVRIYVDFTEKIQNGKKIYVVSRYIKGILINVNEKTQEEIISIK